VLLFTWSPSFDGEDVDSEEYAPSKFTFSLYSSDISGKLVLIWVALLSTPIWGYMYDTLTPLLVARRSGIQASLHLFLSVLSTSLVMGYKGSKAGEELVPWFILNSLAAVCIGGSITLWPALLAELYPSSLLASLGAIQLIACWQDI
jgi:hypothetical protein